MKLNSAKFVHWFKGIEYTKLSIAKFAKLAQEENLPKHQRFDTLRVQS